MIAIPSPYVKRVNSEVEQTLESVLIKLIEDFRIRVLSHTRLAAALNIDSLELTEDLKHFALTSEFDFVITNLGTQPLAVIELNDRSHLAEEARVRDRKKHSLCAKAQVKLFTFVLEDLAQDICGLTRVESELRGWLIIACPRFVEQQFSERLTVATSPQQIRIA